MNYSNKTVVGPLKKPGDFSVRKINTASIGASFYGKFLWFDNASNTAYLDDGGSRIRLEVKPFHASFFGQHLIGLPLRIENNGLVKSKSSDHSYLKITVQIYDHFAA